MGIVNIRNSAVLLIEPLEQQAADLKKALSGAGFSKVTLAASGKDALVQMTSAKFNAVIMGWNLTDIPAPQVFAALKSRIGIIVVADSPEAATAAKQSGADCVFKTPLKHERLFQVLDSILMAKMGIISSKIGEREDN